MLFLCSAPRKRLFSLYVDKRLDDTIYGGVDDHFASIPVHVNRNVTRTLNKVNCSLWVKVPFLLSALSFEFSTFCKMASLTVSFIIGFSDREAFPCC